MSNYEKCFLFDFKSFFCSRENQIIEFYIFKFHGIFKLLFNMLIALLNLSLKDDDGVVEMEKWTKFSFPGVKFWCDSAESEYLGCFGVVVTQFEKRNEAGGVVDARAQYVGGNNSVYDFNGRCSECVIGNGNEGLKTSDKESAQEHWEFLRAGFIGWILFIGDCFEFPTWDKWDDSMDKDRDVRGNCWQLRNWVVARDECDTRS